MSVRSILRARVWLTAPGAFLVLSLAGCQDRSSPTEPLQVGSSMAVLEQIASAPVVNSLADPGDGTCDDTECTLREAITFAGSGATITFATGLSGTITLGNYLNIAKYLTISGPGPDQLAVSGDEAELVFWITGGHSTISGLTIRDGLGWGNGGGGVVVTNSGTTATLENCVLANNHAGSFNYHSGGALWMNSGTDVTISSCTLSGNTALNSGQAIYQYGGSLTILNSTITGSGYGTGKEAVYKYSGTTRIDHSTITANGVGVMLSTAGSGVTVKGSIISGNTSADVYGSSTGAFTSLGYNLIGTSGTNFNVLPDFGATGDQTGVTAPGLAPLALNSPGLTPTHALEFGSPAIDAGVCTDIDGSTLSTDQRGVTRPQGSACDIGAYEMEPVTLQDPATPVVNTLADHDDGACSTSDCTLREAIKYASSGATITFASDLSGWIDLGISLPPLVIDAPLTINGPGASVVAVSGSSTRVLDVQPGGTAAVTIRDLTIRDGQSDTDGAGVLVRSGTVLLEGVDVLNNRYSSGGTFYGGGIAIQGTSAVTVRRSSIRYNQSSYRGAGISVADGSALTVESSTISGNIASGYGGGLYSAGTVTVTNSTIAANSASLGGGAFINGGSLSLASSTVALNDAGSGYGGGIYALSGSVALTGTILGGNTATNNPDLAGSGSGLTASYTLIGSAADAASFGISDGVNGNVVGSGPGFDGGLTTNGGPTETIALGAASPALDQVPSGTIGCGSTVTTDQRGVTRPQGDYCDIGSYEATVTGPVEYELDVSKTATTSITREYVWEISKGPDHDYRGFAGDSWNHTYEIEVQQNKVEEEPTYTDVGWSVSGTITIENNTSVAATIEGVSDVVSSDIPATVDCGVTVPYTLSAGSTLQCSYAADLSDGTSRTNTATVTTTGDVAGGTATTSVDFAEAVIINGNPVVHVTDDNATPDDLTDDRESGELEDGGGFEYSYSFQCPTAESGDYVDGVYTETRVNTATIDEYPGKSDNATVTLTCYAPASAKVVKTTTEGGDDIGQFPFTFELYAPESLPGQTSPAETVVLNAAGEVSFTTELKEEGSWTVVEVLPAGWANTSDLTCALVVDYPPLYDESNTSPAGRALTCSFDNVEKSRVDLLKLTNGFETTTQIWNFALYSGADGFGGTSLANDFTPPALLNFGPVDLNPAGTYTLCELNVPASYSTFWQIDTDGDGTGDVTMMPYNPNADDDPPEDLGHRCVEIGVGTGIELSAGTTLHFAVDNAQPGGAPRSNGYWKNWNACTNGGQAEAAVANGGWEEGFWLLEDVLNPDVGGGVNWDDILSDDFFLPITSCSVAVDILDKRKIGNLDEVADGKKQASDPLFSLAAHLLAAQLNLGAGACSTEDVLGWVLEAETLLDEYNFDANGHDRLGKKDEGGVRATELATLLDSYNIGMVCGNGGD